MPATTPRPVEHIREALDHLRCAQQLLRKARAKRAASAARRALRSAEGAERRVTDFACQRILRRALGFAWQSAA